MQFPFGSNLTYMCMAIFPLLPNAFHPLTNNLHDRIAPGTRYCTVYRPD